jgi:uncharacterized protein YkwD
MSSPAPLPAVRRALTRGRLLALLLVVAVAIAGCEASRSDALTELNQDRVSHSVPKVRRMADLDRLAQDHAEKMAAATDLWHSTLRIPSGYSTMGENVGYGSSISRVEDSFMASSVHRANILNRKFTEVGIGAAWNGKRVYVVQLFRG